MAQDIGREEARHALEGRLAGLLARKPRSSHPRNDEVNSTRKELGAAHVQFDSDDVRRIDEALATLTVQGARYPPHLQSLVGR